MTIQSNNNRISPLSEADFTQWYALWQNYLTFYETALSEETSNATWEKLLDNAVPIYGFGAYYDDKLVGITHVVLHPNTWDTTDCCYLEDLYVDESARGHGIGRALIEHVYDFAKGKDCNRVYWVTQKGNEPARKLYDSLANLTDMVQYRYNL